MRLNDATISERDREARSNIPYDMTTEEGRQAAWAAYSVPAEEEAETDAQKKTGGSLG